MWTKCHWSHETWHIHSCISPCLKPPHEWVTRKQSSLHRISSDAYTASQGSVSTEKAICFSFPLREMTRCKVFRPNSWLLGAHSGIWRVNLLPPSGSQPTCDPQLPEEEWARVTGVRLPWWRGQGSQVALSFHPKVLVTSVHFSKADSLSSVFPPPPPPHSPFLSPSLPLSFPLSFSLATAGRFL